MSDPTLDQMTSEYKIRYVLGAKSLALDRFEAYGRYFNRLHCVGDTLRSYIVGFFNPVKQAGKLINTGVVEIRALRGPKEISVHLQIGLSKSPRARK